MTQEKVVSESQLHIAIAGAGATGLELAAELHASTRQLVEFGLDRFDSIKSRLKNEKLPEYTYVDYGSLNLYNPCFFSR